MIPYMVCSYRLCNTRFFNVNLNEGCVLTWHEDDGTVSIVDKTNGKIYFKSTSGKQDDKISVGAAREHEIVEHFVTPLAWKYDLNWMRTGTNEDRKHHYTFSNR